MTTPEGPESNNPTPPEGEFNLPPFPRVLQQKIGQFIPPEVAEGQAKLYRWTLEEKDVRSLVHRVKRFCYVNEDEILLAGILVAGLYFNHRLTRKTYKTLSNQILALRSSDEITRAFVTGHDLALDEVDWLLINAEQASIRDGLDALLANRGK